MDYFISIENYIEDNLKKEITNNSFIEMYFNIGKILSDKNYKEFQLLELYLKNKYGIVIGFTKRNLNNMKHFYNFYKNIDLNYINNISWKTHLLIINKKDISLLNIVNNYRLNKSELEYYLNTNEIIKKNIYEVDDMLIEFINLKNTLDKK